MNVIQFDFIFVCKLEIKSREYDKHFLNSLFYFIKTFFSFYFIQSKNKIK